MTKVSSRSSEGELKKSKQKKSANTQKRGEKAQNGEKIKSNNDNSTRRLKKATGKKNPIKQRNSHQCPKTSSRIDELSKLEHKLANNKGIKLINSTNKSKIYRIQVDHDDNQNHKDIYKLTVPLSETDQISLARCNTNDNNHNYNNNVSSNDPLSPEKHYMSFVIKNFNFKVSQSCTYKKQKKDIFFFFNYLVNNYDFLRLDPHHYKLYETNKLLI